MSKDDRVTGNDFCKLMESILGPGITSIEISFQPERVIEITWNTPGNTGHRRVFFDDEKQSLWTAVASATGLNDEDWREMRIQASAWELALTVATMQFKPLLEIDWSRLEDDDRQSAD